MVHEKLLSYARERHSDNDIMRGFRQQEIIQAVEDKLKSGQSIMKIMDIIDSLNGNIQTDVDSNELTHLVKEGLTWTTMINNSFLLTGALLVMKGAVWLNYIQIVLKMSVINYVCL